LFCHWAQYIFSLREIVKNTKSSLQIELQLTTLQGHFTGSGGPSLKPLWSEEASVISFNNIPIFCLFFRSHGLSVVFVNTLPFSEIIKVFRTKVGIF
jgi:hypothetical protein